MAAPKKSLGQHWLHNREVLARIVDEAELTGDDVVLEIGPGLGTLTSELLRRAKKVIAVEFDNELARKLPGQFPGKDLEVIHGDFLTFDLAKLPKGYKVVANVPYYITSKIIQRLMAAPNKPSITVLLVQKEVAERLAAQPGDMSILAISAQAFAEVSMGEVIPAALFTPPPKVDSAVVTLTSRSKPLFEGVSEKAFFKVVKTGFSAPRKKLYSNLAGGLGMAKDQAKALLEACGIPPDIRAEGLSLDDWRCLTSLIGKPS
jgi:16S rRNA (adenine1518-N6/adenine1519-N6)-dimethyltransferase